MHKKHSMIYFLLALVLGSMLFVVGCGDASNGDQAPQEAVYEE